MAIKGFRSCFNCSGFISIILSSFTQINDAIANRKALQGRLFEVNIRCDGDVEPYFLQLKFAGRHDCKDTHSPLFSVLFSDCRVRIIIILLFEEYGNN